MENAAFDSCDEIRKGTFVLEESIQKLKLYLPIIDVFLKIGFRRIVNGSEARFRSDKWIRIEA